MCQALRNLQIAFGPILDGNTLEEVMLWADEIYETSDINLTKGIPLETDNSLPNTTLGLVVLDDIVEFVLPGTCVCVCVRARSMCRSTDRNVFANLKSSFDMLFYCRWSCIPSRPKKGRSYSFCEWQGVA